MKISYSTFIDNKFIMKITHWLYNNLTHSFPTSYKGWINLLGSQFRFCHVSIEDDRPQSINTGRHYVKPFLLMERLMKHRILINVNGDIYIGLFGLSKRKNMNDGYQAIKKMKIY